MFLKTETKTWELRLTKTSPAIRSTETEIKIPYPTEGQSMDEWITDLTDECPELIDALDGMEVRIPDANGNTWKCSGLFGQAVAGVVLACRKVYGPVKAGTDAEVARINADLKDIVVKLTEGKIDVPTFMRQNDALQKELMSLSKRDKEKGSWYLVDEDK